MYFALILSILYLYRKFHILDIWFLNYNSYSIFSNLTFFLLNYKFYCLILNYHLIPSPSFHPATRRHLRNYHSIPIATICKFANSYLSQILIFGCKCFCYALCLTYLQICVFQVTVKDVFPLHFHFPCFQFYYGEKHSILRIKFVYQLWLISINIWIINIFNCSSTSTFTRLTFTIVKLEINFKMMHFSNITRPQ